MCAGLCVITLLLLCNFMEELKIVTHWDFVIYAPQSIRKLISKRLRDSSVKVQSPQCDKCTVCSHFICKMCVTMPLKDWINVEKLKNKLRKFI